MKIGQVVYSKSGRDKNRFLIVFKICDGYVFVVDGKERPLSNPKRKNPKHLSSTNHVFDPNCLRSNRSVRSALNEFLKNKTNSERGH